MKVVVVGYGSIGARHARVLREMGHVVAVVSRRPQTGVDCYPSIAAAIDGFVPDYVVVASRTREHADNLAALAGRGFEGIVLVEKPLFDRDRPVPAHRFSRVFVAFNLRFHPALRRFAEILAATTPHAVHAYVGQYLPDWRPGTDYRDSYSAKKAEGGGVLRDLSHELDYLNWLLGGWTRATALGGHVSGLEIDSDDVYSVLFETANCPVVSVAMNYLDSNVRREAHALTDKGTIHLDLVAQTVTFGGTTETFSAARDETYIAEHEAALGNGAGLCTLEAGVQVMKLIDACEQAAGGRTWIAA